MNTQENTTVDHLTHPLIEKKFSSPPHFVHEWLDAWHGTDNPLHLMGLLHHGPNVADWFWAKAGKDDPYYMMPVIYLQIATRFWDRTLFPVKQGDGKPSISKDPGAALSMAAFQVLCNHCFRIDQHTEEGRGPWTQFVYDARLLDELLAFLGVDNLSSDTLRVMLIYAKERYADVLADFVKGLALFLIRQPSFGYLSEETNRTNRALWQPRRKAAIKILWTIGQLDLLIEYKEYVDSDLLKALETMILDRELGIPVSSRSSKTVVRRPRAVQEILRIDASKYGWNQIQDVIKATYIYLGLTARYESA